MKENGFSLFELIIILFVIGVLFQFGFFQFESYKEKKRLIGAHQELLLFLYSVQNQSNWENKTIEVYYFFEDEKHVFFKTNNKNDKIFFTKKQVDHVNLTKEIILFYGKRNRAQANTIQLENKLGFTRIIISTQGRIRDCTNLSIKKMPKC